MVVIDGREFNLTQIGPNRYLNNIKSAKEAQELAQALKNLDHEVVVVKEGKKHKDGKCNRIEMHFNWKPQLLKGDPLTYDGIKYGSIELKSTQKAFSTNYTADDALAANWAIATGHTIFADPAVKNSAAYEITQSEYLNHVRENGLDKAINWSEVSFGFDTFSIQAKDFTACTDYAAALYASVDQRIRSDFSGEEMTSQLDKLDSLYNGFKEKLSERYADNLKELYDFHDIDIPRDQVAKDVATIMDQKTKACCNYVKSHEDYADLDGNIDSWLKRDVTYMANQLRDAIKGQEVNSRSYFSENDIVALGLNAEMYKMNESDKPYCYSMGLMNTEESMGLAIAANYLAANEMCDKMNVSNEVRNIMEQTVDKYKSYAIENVNKQLAFIASWEESDPSAFPPLNEEVIDSVINTAMNSYKMTGDTFDSLQRASHFAYKTYQTNSKDSTAERYHRRTDIPEWNFWQEFYDDGRGTSYMGKILDKWNTFTENLNNRNYDFLANTMSGSYFQRHKSLICGLYSPSSL